MTEPLTRLIRCVPELFDHLAMRTEDDRLVTVEWRDPIGHDAETGEYIYEPVFTATDDGMVHATLDAEREVFRTFAQDVARQYGYVSNGALHTGGMSIIEDAFAILGWQDPHPLEIGDPQMCEVPGCGAATIYWAHGRHTCQDHYKELTTDD